MFATTASLRTFDSGALHASADGQEFFELASSYLSLQDQKRLSDAFELARHEHGPQRRKSGEPFYTHPLTVAYYLAEYRLDADALLAALLHDVAEDTVVSIDQIGDQFGPEVSRLVDGVTKLKEVSAGVARDHSLTAKQIQDASLHKMFDAMTTDVRVVLIKLFDRLHNMRTIGALLRDKQRLKADETLLVYAPLANRLGIWRLKTELEGLSLQVIDSEAYRLIKQGLEHQYHKQRLLYSSITEQIIEQLRGDGLNVIDVLPNPESVYSVYKTLSAASAPFDSAVSPLRLVVLLEDELSCYLALGLLHKKWRPIPGKFDDYIALPRDNLYRALHTTVIHSDGQPLKLRFRSVAMNEVSEIGVLARWYYAGTPLWTQGIAERVEALFANVVESMSLEPQDLSTSVRGVVEDVFGRQVMIYTPRGDVIELPLGATPVDFAYAIHTEVGNQCLMAYVNEKPYPLNKPLSDGDQVRIVKSGRATPQRTWLDEDLGYLGTSRTLSHVRRWFRRLPKSLAIREGCKLLLDELEMLGMPGRSPQQVAEQFGYDDVYEMYFDLGRAELLPTTVSTRLLAMEWHQEPARHIGSVVQAAAGRQFVITNAGGRPIRLCKSCNARPGDSIVGVLRSDGGVTAHKESCYTLRPDPLSDRTIKLAWGKEGEQEVRIVAVQIDVHDRPGLLFEIAELLQSEGVNISSIHTRPAAKDDQVRVIADLEIASPRQLIRIMHRIHALINVFKVSCLRSLEQSLPPI